MYIGIKVLSNPWLHSVGGDGLMTIIHRVAVARAAHVAKQFAAGDYKRESLGLAIMNPSAPISADSMDALLATVAIGPEGDSFVPNAIAKAVQHRDSGQLAGYGVYVDLTRTQDGDFCYGFSTQVDDTIAGASGQSELQDACEAGHAAVTFNYLLRSHRKEWVDAHSGNRWFCNIDEPAGLYTRLANQEGSSRSGCI